MPSGIFAAENDDPNGYEHEGEEGSDVGEVRERTDVENAGRNAPVMAALVLLPSQKCSCRTA